MEIYNGTYCVYAHINKINGKIYVGQTCQKPEYRWSNGKGYVGCPYFYKAIQKYGWDGFEHEVVASNLTLKEANHFEELLIQKLDTMNPEKGYNLRSGGENNLLSDEIKKKFSGMRKGENNPMYGISPKERMDKETYNNWKLHCVQVLNSPEVRKKQIESCFGKKYSYETNKKKGRSGKAHHQYGKPVTEETREKISKANTGRVHANETKKKISLALSGENNPFYGKHHTEETRKKISESNKGENSSSATMVLQYQDQNNLIRIWGCIQQAADELGINSSCIGSCCRGMIKTAGRYKWLYVYDKTKRDGTIINGAISLGYITEEDIKCLKF